MCAGRDDLGAPFYRVSPCVASDFLGGQNHQRTAKEPLRMGAYAPIFAALWTPIYEGALLLSPIKFPARKIKSACLRFNPGPLRP